MQIQNEPTKKEGLIFVISQMILGFSHSSCVQPVMDSAFGEITSTPHASVAIETSVRNSSKVVFTQLFLGYHGNSLETL